MTVNLSKEFLEKLGDKVAWLLMNADNERELKAFFERENGMAKEEV